MAVSLTEWRFARPADALPPALARGPLFCFLRNLPTYLRNATRTTARAIARPHLSLKLHYISLRSPATAASGEGTDAPPAKSRRRGR